VDTVHQARAPERITRFEQLVELVGEPLRRYALRRLDPAAADDALAEALLVLWRRLDDVPAGAELPWSYGVLRNCVANETRSARRRDGLVVRLSAQPATPPTGPDAGGDPDLTAALARLRPAEQELLRLWAWEDLAPADIAVVLGTSTNAVHIRLHRARRRLAELLDDGRKVTGGPGQDLDEGGRRR
jgi:RNA polymerase sigma-70 factor (ECF subfamily)